MILEREIEEWLSGWFGDGTAAVLVVPTLIIMVGLAAVLSYFVFHRLCIPIITRIVKRTRTEWDDDILTPEVLRAISQLVPALIVAWLLPKVFEDSKTYSRLIVKLTDLYIVVAIVHMVNAAIRALFDGFAKRYTARAATLKGIFQMTRLVVIGGGVIFCVSILFGKSPVTVFTAIGASAAVLMLVFKDTILGLVAGIQLSANNMLRKGDWIVCQRAGANGEVLDISLTTVKIRNWDNSVITIPPYNLISDSFQNYEPMRIIGGRRVARSVCIDVNSVRFLSPDELARLKEAALIPADTDVATLENSINLGLFRRHIAEWLKNHADVITRKGHTMFVMVRELQSTPEGIPLELYFFTTKTEWLAYEDFQSDIFDYVYATVPRFALRIYQAPSACDIRSIGR